MKTLSFLLGAATVALIFAALAVAGVFEADKATTVAKDTAAPTPAPARPVPTPGGGASVADIYERVAPGVVFVTTRTDDLDEVAPLLDPRGQPSIASGSGFVIDDQGHIITNQHVVDDAKTARVHFGDGDEGEFINARVVGTDASTDIAVLKIDPAKVEGGLKPLPLGSSKQLRPGDAAIAIGSPFGLEGSITTGIVSALERPIQAPNGFTIQGALQTDAAINPGNSGGPLLDAEGKVIGINSQIATTTRTNSGVGFAVPVDTVKQVVPQLKANGKIERAYLGVSSGTVTPDIRERLDLQTNRGAVIDRVNPGSPASAAGLRPRDVITRIDGKAVTSSEDVVALVGAKKPGDKVKVEVQRGGASRTFTVTLRERPESVRGR